jgi:hypothetical protein
MEGISVNLARLGTAVKSLGIIREKKKILVGSFTTCWLIMLSVALPYDYLV